MQRNWFWFYLQCGACGIPSLFIQRYSDELKQEISSVAIVLDQIRIHQLQTSRKPVVSISQNFSTNFMHIKFYCFCGEIIR